MTLGTDAVDDGAVIEWIQPRWNARHPPVGIQSATALIEKESPMSAIKTATSALTAAVLVTSIGLAWAQTEDQNQPTDPVAAATAAPLSEQTPADPNAAPADPNAVMPAESTAAVVDQPLPADDPARVTPPVDSTAALPSTTTTDTTTTTTTTATPSPSYEPAAPAPRADRN
jgi:hypothetical protein